VGGENLATLSARERWVMLDTRRLQRQKAAVFRRFLSRALVQVAARLDRNLAGVTCFPPGSYYSTLLDIETLKREPAAFVGSSARAWEGIDLREEAQGARLDAWLASPSGLPLSDQPDGKWRYFAKNHYFVFADGFALTQMIAEHRPCRIIEVGAGFSSAAILDAREHLALNAELTLIEPYPDRLETLLLPADRSAVKLLKQPVQSVPDETFFTLESGDFLFIDSSHVAKVGSDLADIFSRVLPRLRPGVFVHFHDIFYPGPYPEVWLRQGRAWNEVLFLQTFLRFNAAFQVEWFNPFAAARFRERFVGPCPRFLMNSGGSIWLRRVN
jgi:predicted O-methyltransferase YrrM